MAVEDLRRKMLCVTELRDGASDHPVVQAAKASAREQLHSIEGTQFILCEFAKVITCMCTGRQVAREDALEIDDVE